MAKRLRAPERVQRLVEKTKDTFQYRLTKRRVPQGYYEHGLRVVTFCFFDNKKEWKVFINGKEYGVAPLERSHKVVLARLREAWWEITKAHPVLKKECVRCAGSGTYCWGAVHNRVPTNSGKCFRCDGKGYLDLSDQKRNYGYDNYQPGI